MRNYVILTAAEAAVIDFDEVMETSHDTLRWNNDSTKTFVKFEGSTPSELVGKTTYTQDEILVTLNDPEGEWYTDPDGL